MAEKLRSKVLQPPGPRLTSVQTLVQSKRSHTQLLSGLWHQKPVAFLQTIEAVPPEPGRQSRGATKSADLMYDRRRRR